MAGVERDEDDWFIEGVERGWLRFFSICSAHQEVADDCDRCAFGTWGLARHKGHFAHVDGTISEFSHTDQMKGLR